MNENPPEILIATSNPGKVREIREALSFLPVKIRSLSEFPDVLPVEEVGLTYDENASLKALGYARQTGLPALADDSGLEVDALNGKPGVQVSPAWRRHLTDRERTEKLLEQLSHVSDSDRTARFVCSMAFAGWQFEDDKTKTAPSLLKTTQGVCQGVITTSVRGRNGFGFDPIFVPDGYAQTFAELPPEIKRTISHRGKALDAMRPFLEDWLKRT